MARRISLSIYLTTMMTTLLIVVTASVLIGHYRSDTGALVGFYGSKNAMGMAAAFLALLAMGNINLRHWRRRQTLVALLGLVTALAAVVLAQSVSALIALAVGFGVLGAVQILRPLPPIVRITSAIVMTVLTTLFVLLAVANLDALVDLILDLTGKDLTLTGRTELWAIASELIAQRPLLGIGYQAFWVPGNPIAEAIWRQFGIENQSGFSFHNTYLSNAVEIGIIGVAIQSLMIGSAVFMTARHALANRDRASATLLSLVAMIVSMTPIDTHIYFQLSLASSIMVSAIVLTTTRQTKVQRPPRARSVARFVRAASNSA
ncbi:O-antigen ligase family protein [Gymnodinialimonas sp. 2305UL16-5]|uniref:O-antigen ligase family protein n=1 Tax=Gymnodinialimonas mytili TaxID=3126503 RepID=UPI0030A1529B